MNSATLAAWMPWSCSTRVEGEVEVGGRCERLLTRQPAEEDDVVAPARPRADALARTADEPEPALRKARVDLFPELQQVVDVVERVVAAAVVCGEQVRRHPADDDLVLATPRRRLRDELVRERAEADSLRDHVPGLVDAELLVPFRRPLRRDDVRLQVGAPQQRDVLVVVDGIVDVRDDRAAEVADLLVVEREHRAVAAVREREDGRVAHAAAPAEGVVLEPARDPPVGEVRQVRVEAREPRQQLRVARVVVSLEPEAREEDPLGAGRVARQKLAETAALHRGRSLCSGGAVDRERALDHAGDREVGQGPGVSRSSEAARALRIREQRGNLPRDTLGVAGFHERAGLAVDDHLRHGADARRDDR